MIQVVDGFHGTDMEHLEEFQSNRLNTVYTAAEKQRLGASWSYKIL